MRKKKRRLGSTKKKILLLLAGGLALGLTHSPKTYFRIVKGIAEEWKKIDRDSLKRAIRSLYKSKLVDSKDNDDGTTTLVLSGKGKQVALKFNLENIQIKKQHQWDKYWRIVISDIPEKRKILRESLRMHLKNMNFIELQKSVYVHPYPCEKEVEFIIEFFDLRRFVRFIVAKSIDNELHLKQLFKLQ